MKLPDSWPDGCFRVNKYAAMAFKSRVALFEGTFRKYHGVADETYTEENGSTTTLSSEWFLRQAAEAAQNVIASGKYSLYNTSGDSHWKAYRDFFQLEDLKGNPEAIFAKHYDVTLAIRHGLQFDLKNETYSATRRFVNHYLCSDGTPIQNRTGWATEEYYEQFQRRDPRMAQTLHGPGHFGWYVEEEGVEKMSFHYEADYNRSGRSVLAVRSLLWKNGWPVAADPFKEGTYEIESERRGYALELAVDFVRQQGGMRAFRIDPNEPVVSLAEQTLEEVEDHWPAGEIPVRAGDYMFRPHQRWTVTAVPDKGGYLGAPYYKITIAGTERALAVDEDGELMAVPAYTGADNELWRIEQLTDGTFRILTKVACKCGKQRCLLSTGDSTVAMGDFDFSSDNCKWNFRDR